MTKNNICVIPRPEGEENLEIVSFHCTARIKDQFDILVGKGWASSRSELIRCALWNFLSDYGIFKICPNCNNEVTHR